MTTLLIPREPIPFALTADQVVAYMDRLGHADSGRLAGLLATMTPDMFAAFAEGFVLSQEARLGRPALDVAEDIAGSAVGVGGVGCESDDAGWNCVPSCGDCDDLTWFPVTGPICNQEAPRAPEVE